jgi:hypothetical protein
MDLRWGCVTVFYEDDRRLRQHRPLIDARLHRDRGLAHESHRVRRRAASTNPATCQ